MSVAFYIDPMDVKVFGKEETAEYMREQAKEREDELEEVHFYHDSFSMIL